MPVYNYKALKADGGVEPGVSEADSPKDARRKLRDKKLRVTNLDAIGKAGEGGVVAGPGGIVRGPSNPAWWRRKRLQDLGVITRQLGTLLGSGIPMMGS